MLLTRRSERRYDERGDHFFNALESRTYFDGKYTWRIDKDGKIIGLAPMTGAPDLLGGPAKGAKALTKIVAKGGAKAIAQFSGSAIDDAVNLVIKDTNKLNHLFSTKHNLGGLVNKLGGQENTVRAVLNAANGKLPASGVFNNIPVNVCGQTVLIRGNVINGIPRLGTMYIP